mgnify:CR=1 FL=1
MQYSRENNAYCFYLLLLLFAKNGKYVNISGQIEEISILPTYIQNKNSVKLYKDVDKIHLGIYSKEVDLMKQKSNSLLIRFAI